MSDRPAPGATSASIPREEAGADGLKYPPPLDDPGLRTDAPRFDVGPSLRWGLFLALPLLVFSATRSAWLGGLMAAGGLAVALVSFQRRMVRFQRDNQEANRLLVEGEPGAAAAAWDQLARRSSGHVGLARLAVFNAGVAQVRGGHLERGMQLVGAVARPPRKPPVVQLNLEGFHLDHEAAALLSAGYTLTGDLVAGERWLHEAARRDADDPNSSRAFAEAVLRCRQARFDEAASTLAERWVSIEGRSTGDRMRRFRLVRAFALAKGDPDAHSDDVDSLVAGCKPCPPGDLVDLEGWPEMKTFIRKHGIEKHALDKHGLEHDHLA